MTSPMSRICFSPVVNGVRSLVLPLRLAVSSKGLYFIEAKRQAKVGLIRLRCIQGFSVYNLPNTQTPNDIANANEEDERAQEEFELIREIERRINLIKVNLRSMDDGKISISAYDTAWVALVKDIHGSDAPQFPSSLEWIANNQLRDGSWGDRLFSAYDRLISTLACVIALTSWNMYPEICNKGIDFLQQNMQKLEDENPQHMPVGFEVTFPSLIEMAQNLGILVPLDSPALQDIYARRDLKLKRIPKEMLHKVATPLRFSLEGMPGLDWERLLKFQSSNGSFLCSPSSTAFALMQTKDEKCLKYLANIVKRLNGGVPNCYPVDLFEHVWVVDRLERLGISQYFISEIKECVDYVYRYWTPKGICWARNIDELSIDDAAMGFRILRLHGYKVDSDTFQNFKRGDEFFCLIGQLNHGVTGMLNFYKASQVLFPGEKILEEAKRITSNFLKEKLALGQIVDKWIITKDLEGEVQYALEVPWYASLPRIETRYYIDQYGGEDDVWIGKVLYRMYNVSNNLYLELAKLDYNRCQKLHQLEWIDIQRWYEECKLAEFGLNKDGLLQSYFLAMSSIFEPERATERVAWARTTALMEAVSLYFCDGASTAEQKRAFIQAFSYGSSNHSNNRKANWNGIENGLVKAIFKTLRDVSKEVYEVHREEVYHKLQHTWKTWLLKLQAQVDKHFIPKDEAELIVCTINLSAGHSLLEDFMSQPNYVNLTNLTNKVCYHLRRAQAWKKEYNKEEVGISLFTDKIELEMQALTQHVLQSTNGMAHNIKQTFMAVAKSFYYSAYYEPTTINLHIGKVLFDRVL